MSELPPVTDAGFAAWLAGRAGELLLRLREELGHDDPAALRDAGDKSSHDLIVAELARWRPADAVLSEEAAEDDPRRLEADRVWTAAAPAYPPLVGGRRIMLAASRTRPPAFLADVAAALDADLVPMGSAGAKIAAVIEGDVDGYVHAGGQYEWDSAAPVAVALATGLHASRLDGSPLEYNRGDPRLPDLVVCRKDLAPRLLAAVRTCL
jgi:3'(2'), 5'-bisphosphate nucleotidase